MSFTFDPPSDTPFVDLDGSARPAVSLRVPVPVDAIDAYLRVDPETEAVVGLQIEGVQAASDRPQWLREALVLTGASRADPGAPAQPRPAAVLAALFDQFAGTSG